VLFVCCFPLPSTTFPHPCSFVHKVFLPLSSTPSTSHTLWFSFVSPFFPFLSVLRTLPPPHTTPHTPPPLQTRCDPGPPSTPTPPPPPSLPLFLLAPQKPTQLKHRYNPSHVHPLCRFFFLCPRPLRFYALSVFPSCYRLPPNPSRPPTIFLFLFIFPLPFSIKAPPPLPPPHCPPPVTFIPSPPTHLTSPT